VSESEAAVLLGWLHKERHFNDGQDDGRDFSRETEKGEGGFNG